MDVSAYRKITLCALGLLSIATGCASDRASYPVRLAPVNRPFVQDIPVPVGFRFVEKVSEDRLSGARRLYLRHVYTGPAAKYDVRNFYHERMPRYRWVKVADGHVTGEYTMRFEKDSEDCTVTIRDREGFRSGSEVQVIITQRQSEAVPPVRRPARQPVRRDRP